MAFTSIIAGDLFNVETSVLPYAPKSGYTPVKGDLVIADASIACGADKITTNENPMGLVLKYENGIASVWKFRTGDRVVLGYTGTVAKGDKVEFGSATADATLGRTVVQTDNTNGVGFVVAVDAETAYGTGFCCVEF